MELTMTRALIRRRNLKKSIGFSTGDCTYLWNSFCFGTGFRFWWLEYELYRTI